MQIKPRFATAAAGAGGIGGAALHLGRLENAWLPCLSAAAREEAGEDEETERCERSDASQAHNCQEANTHSSYAAGGTGSQFHC